MTFWMSGRPGSHCAVSARPTSTFSGWMRNQPSSYWMIESGGPQLGPRLFERHRFHALQDVVRDLRTAVRETLAFPVRRVLDEQFLREDSGLCKRRSRAQHGTLERRESAWSSPPLGSNHGVPGTCALRAPSSFISTPIPDRSGRWMKPF